MVKAKAILKTDAYPMIEFTDSKGITGRARGGNLLEAAMKRPIIREEVVSGITQLGDTQFHCESVDLEMDTNIFLPVSVLKALRRRAINELKQNRIAAFEKKYRLCRDVIAGDDNIHAKKGKTSNTPLLYGYFSEIDENISIYSGLDGFCFKPKRWPVMQDDIHKKIDMIKNRG